MPYPVDLSDFVNQASPAVIEAILRDMQKIVQENAEMLERMRNAASGSNPGENPGGLSPDELDRYQNNLDNLIANILKQARDQNLIEPGQLQALIDEANKQSDTKIDLNNVPPLQLSDEEKQQQERQKQLEEELRKRQEEQNKQREAQNQALLDKIKAERERLEQENKKKQEEAAKLAEELYKQGLSDAERQKFEEQQKALEQQRQQQDQAQQPQVPKPTTTPTPTTPTTTPETEVPTTPVRQKVAKPTATFENETTLELTTTTSGAVIYYTTDGTEPSSTNGTKYIEPIELQQSTTIKAIAVKPGYVDSDVMTVSYETPSVFSDGYPKAITGEIPGSKLINIVVKTNKPGEVRYVVLKSGAPAPTIDQIFDFDYLGSEESVIAYGNRDIGNSGQLSLEVELDDDNTEYDVYVLMVVGGNQNEVRKVVAITPSAAEEIE
ncbi:chitobiase/beta-hexosaminidase C-terminal domain-containing protein [Paenibacillus sp. D2_2]|uniref:chitobiase/beta-hexosaminidase C-terminal domain-containing protein n=1 Tax=Paenibacillus sp. D2_2 TaxID=3073092 RepID=UPI002814BB79|nr:chitobiase/beta-hexosaminidase C-terminal domain-containing protein [Paenibacillus sp. D2_2]WMT40931.1 chitobiase/beta-hexosaminidase C-terminal domain-containing protein [Paenibacillus sp. D2_2]